MLIFTTPNLVEVIGVFLGDLKLAGISTFMRTVEAGKSGGLFVVEVSFGIGLGVRGALCG